MFDSEELRNLATDDRYSTVQVASKELLSLLDEYDRLRRLATCGCGDTFTEHDTGTCGNCLAGTDRTAEVERLRKVLRKLKKVKYLYSTYASGSSRKSYGQMIDDAMGPNA